MLGEGSQGKVFQCRTMTGLPVAIKEVPTVTKRDQDKVSDEVHAVRAVRCKHVVGVLATFHDRRKAYIVTELGAQGGLEGILENIENNGKVLDEATIRKVVKQCLSALQACHRSGVAHCGVSSKNIVVRNNAFDVMLVDFREAVVDCGEQAKQFDIRGLGVVAWQMLYGVKSWSALLDRLSSTRKSLRIPVDEIERNLPTSRVLSDGMRSSLLLLLDDSNKKKEIEEITALL
ncbi:MAG: protein kinase family protein [Myxococcota bacterium]